MMNPLPPIVSLSSKCLEKMAESKWFYPSQYKERENYDTERPLDGLQKSGNVTYRLNQIRAITARTIATLAAYSLLSPISCLYHTSQAIPLKKIANLSETERALIQKHVTCAKLELFRVATVASALSIFILFNGVTLGIAPISALLLVLDIGIAGPFYGSRLGDITTDDEKWRAIIGLRRELGITDIENPQEILRTLITHSAKRSQKAIKQLLMTLPQEYRFPIDHINGCSASSPEINLDLILRHCSVAMNHLDSDNKEKIIDLANQLIQYNSLTHRLLYYLDIEQRKFPLDLHQIKSSLQKGNCKLPKRKKIPRTPHHRPLTVSLLIKTLSSDWLYPSNYKPRIVKEKWSIASTLHRIDPFEKRKKIQTRLHKPLKALRWIARAIAQTGIILVGAPTGAALNTFRAFRHYTASHFKNEFEAYSSIETAKSYLQAAHEDISLLNFSNIRGPWLRMIYNHHEAISTVKNKHDRAAIALATALKNNFGICGSGGKLLAHNLDEDIPVDRGTHPYLQKLIDEFKTQFDQGLLNVIHDFNFVTLMHMNGLLKRYYHTNDPAPLAIFLRSKIQNNNSNDLITMINALYKLAELKGLTYHYHSQNESQRELPYLSFFNTTQTDLLIAQQTRKRAKEFIAIDDQLKAIHSALNTCLKIIPIALHYQNERHTFHYLYFFAYQTGNSQPLEDFLRSTLYFPSRDIKNFTVLISDLARLNKLMKEMVEASPYESLKKSFSEFPHLKEQLQTFKMHNALEWVENLPHYQAKLRDAQLKIAQRKLSTPSDRPPLEGVAKSLKLSKFIPKMFDHRPHAIHHPLSLIQKLSLKRLSKDYISLRSLFLTPNLMPRHLFGFTPMQEIKKETVEAIYKKLKGKIDPQRTSSLEELRLEAETLLKMLELAKDLLMEEMDALLPIAK